MDGMAKAGQLVLAVAAAAVLGWLLFFWMGGSGQFLGVPIGSGYQPPAFPPGHTNAVAVAAKARGVYLGEPDGLKEWIGYHDRTDVAVYRGEWSGTRGGQPVTIKVEADTSGGKWRVVRWNER